MDSLRLCVGEQDRDVRGRRMDGGPWIAGVDLNVDLAMLGAEALQPRNKQLGGEEGRQEYAQAPPAAAAGDLGDAAVERHEQRLDLLEEGGASRGELQGARLAHEELYAERRLQLLHLVADRGWCQIQLVSGELEAPMTCGDAEDPQVPGRRRAVEAHHAGNCKAVRMHRAVQEPCPIPPLGIRAIPQISTHVER